MSRFPLRDLADRLTTAPDLEAAIDALLLYLHAVQPDWHPTVVLHGADTDILERVYRQDRGRLERRELRLAVDDLPARLVRKFFRPSAFFNGDERRNLLEKLFQSSPSYEPERFEAGMLAPLLAPVAWQSCVCLPLADRDDLLGLLCIVSPKPRAFAGTVLDELLPLRSLVALSLARRMHAGGRPTPEGRAAEEHTRRATNVLQERIHELQRDAERLAQENHEKSETLAKLSREVELLRQSTTAYVQERRELKEMLAALEDQNASAGVHLAEAYAELSATQTRASETSRTLDFLREAFETLAQTREAPDSTRRIVQWFCEQFQVDRCSLMRLEDGESDLRIMAQRGLDPNIAGRVRVPVGSGVSGWVARNRKPLFVRDDLDVGPIGERGSEEYNSDSFISVPLLHRNRIVGVLNLSNKRDGEAFDETDLERAQLAGAVLALSIGSPETLHGKVTVTG